MSQYEHDVEFEKKMIAGAMQHQLDTATVFTRNRKLSVGASEIAKCLRMTRYAKDELIAVGKSKPRPNPSGGFMLRGSVMEDAYIAPFMQKMLEADGYTVEYMGENQESFLSQETDFLTATPDGKASKGKEKFLLEYKSLDPRTNLTEPKPENVFQCHVQMALTGVRTFVYLCYINASDWFDIKVFKIPYDKKVYELAVKRANMVRDKKVLKLPKEGLMTDSCKFCKYKIMCKNDEEFKGLEEKQIHGTNVQTKESFKAKKAAQKYLKLDAELKAVKLAHKEAERDLKCLMEKPENKYISTNGFFLELLDGKPSQILDRARIEEEFEISLDDYKTTSDKTPKPRLKKKLTRTK
jgi:hypothetical protein